MKETTSAIPPKRLPVSKNPLRILCAEDDAAIGGILAQLFTVAGHTVELVTDGFMAWDALSKDLGHFQVLVTDHQMPGLNGLELVELLRQAGYRGRIIVHSGALTLRDTERYRAFKVDRIVAKMTPPDEFLRILDTFNSAQVSA